MAVNFPNNPSNGQIHTEGNKSWQWLGNRWGAYNVQNPEAFAFRNKIINGNFDIWQRATATGSWISPVPRQYLADRWDAATNGTGGNGAWTRQSFTPGQTDVPNEPTYFSRIQVSSSASGQTRGSTLPLEQNYIEQRIEDVRTLAGKTATLSFYAKINTNQNMTVWLGQNFGTGGSSSVTVSEIINLTTSWQKFTLTFNIPVLFGKTIGSNSYLTVVWNLPINTTYTFDIAQVQLEEGSVATPFEQRPIGTELALCQRYYCKSFSPNTTPASNIAEGYLATHEPISENGTIHNSVTKFPVTMRATPVVTFYNPSEATAANIIYMSPANNSRATVASYAASPYGVSTITTSFTDSNTEPVGSLRASHWQFTATAEL